MAGIYATKAAMLFVMIDAAKIDSKNWLSEFFMDMDQ